MRHLMYKRELYCFIVRVTCAEGAIRKVVKICEFPRHVRRGSITGACKEISKKCTEISLPYMTDAPPLC